MIEELQAWTSGQLMGRVERDAKRDRMTFVYGDKWRSSPDAMPLSLSMPLTAAEHRHEAVEPFLWGLLPDNEGVLARWGQRFHCSPRNVFHLLSHVGEECAGAVQFVAPERAAEWNKQSASGRVQWMSEEDIAARLRLLLQDHGAARTARDRGQFSLAGAEPKTAFHFDPKQNRWGVPSGTAPTTHIFKPPTGDFDGYAENEHFCLSLARALGLAAAPSAVMRFGGIPVIVIERFDRIRAGRTVRRIHQEDMCQALSIMPQMKYQNQGGPSAAEIMSLIRRQSNAREQDESRFLDALAFNWLIGGTDAHAKNYAFLIAGRGQARLAPLYDLSSALPYFPRQLDPRRATLAMKLGGKCRIREVGLREWKKCAAELRTDEAALIERIASLATGLPDAAEDIRKHLHRGGMRHSVITRLAAALRDRAAACLALVKK